MSKRVTHHHVFDLKEGRLRSHTSKEAALEEVRRLRKAGYDVYYKHKPMTFARSLRPEWDSIKATRRSVRFRRKQTKVRGSR